MLLTITYEGNNTQDLGYLLHKNPERAQQFTLSFGKAYVFYPEVSDERTTAALLLDIDPLDLARGKEGSSNMGLFEYVNDRPYACTSFLSTAISRVFNTALSGKCTAKPELAETPLPLTACLPCLRDGGDEELAKKMFEPLGYSVEAKRDLLDPRFPEWGMSPYISLTLKGTVRLSQLLNHLYVLIPVFDRQKHYYSSADEIKKLLSHGEGWLSTHPYSKRITWRYFADKKGYARKALDLILPEEADQEDAQDAKAEAAEEQAYEAGLLAAGGEGSEEANPEQSDAGGDAAGSGTARAADVGAGAGAGEENGASGEGGAEPAPVFGSDDPADEIAAGNGTADGGAPRVPLNTLRMEAVRDAVLASGAETVLDLGCGEGRLTHMLLQSSQIKKVTACDVSARALEIAARRLRLERMPAVQREKLTLMQASLTYRDKRFDGYDCACLVEVIEHIDPMRLTALERSVFEFAGPRTVIVTTPNREYNVNYPHLGENELRHSDHRFEWTRSEFAAWTEKICRRYGYECELRGIGAENENTGAPTQMVVFTKNG